MTCRYFDAGWCYAPEDAKNNSIQGGCFEPEYCATYLMQNKMTDFQPKKQNPEEVANGLRDAFRQAIKDGVMDATPYLKQMEPKIEIDPSLILKSGDCIYYHGIKYQKVVEPKSFYNKLWDLLKTKLNDTIDCDELTDEVMDLIKDTIPEPLENKYHSDVIQGYNTAIKDIVENF